jgi:dienelactone hydrolase
MIPGARIPTQKNAADDGSPAKRGKFRFNDLLTWPQVAFFPVLVTLLFLGTLFWAKQQDGFSRRWFTLATADHGSFNCVAVLPKPGRQYPIILYAHGEGGSLLTDGTDLRQMAELGLAVVSLEYNQTNPAAFSAQWQALRGYLSGQKWADTNAIAWVGFSLGAGQIRDFARQHPEQRPQLIAFLSETGLVAGAAEKGFNSGPGPVLLVHGNLDETFPADDTRRLATALETNGVPVTLKIFPALGHDLEPERSLIFRALGEYCRTALMGVRAWDSYHSLAERRAKVPPLWIFWLPAGSWMAGWALWWWWHRPTRPEKIRLQRHEIILRWLTLWIAVCALLETSLHLATPHFTASPDAIGLARRFLIQPRERADFEFLATKPVWGNEKLKTLLEHVELTGYDRPLTGWQLDDPLYQTYVLSPIITGAKGESLNWRRTLWEEFYPRIRHEISLESAARIVGRHLRERVTIATPPQPARDVPAIWQRQITDEAGFQIIYVAVLRSVGIPARLAAHGQAEFWNGRAWMPAPAPALIRW